MTSADQVRALLNQCWEAPHGPGQIALVEQALVRADAVDDDQLRFEARMLATNAYQFGGEPVKGFVTFAWCLARYDGRPDDFGQHESSLLWQFKYMISSMTQFPEVPLSRAEQILDDMERRFRAGGHSLQAVYKYRHRVARHVGDEPATERYYELWQSAPRDGNSDCRGCDPNSQLAYLISRGRDEEAIELSEPVLAGRLTCSEQPQSILTTLLLPYLRTGRFDEARAAHHKAYRAHRGNPANLYDVAEHVYFCAMSGNAAAGLELIERHWSWLERPPSPMAEMEFCSSAAVVLARLVEQGYGDQQVRPAGETIADLAGELARRAGAIAERFDRRNGTAHQTRSTARKLAAEPIVTELPLSLAARLGAEIRQPAGPRVEPEQPVDPVADVPLDAAADLVFDLAEEALRRDQEARAQALYSRLVELAGVRELTVLQQGRLADLRGMQLHGDDVEGTEQTWQQALECYLTVGDTVREHRIRGRLGLYRCRHGQVEQGLTEVRESTAYLMAHGEPKEQAGALRRLAVALLHAERPVEALQTLDRLADVAEPDPGPRIRLQVLLLRAQSLGADGQLEASVAASRVLVEQATRDGDHDLIGLAEFFLGQGLSLLEDVPGAVAAFDRALSGRLPIELEREVRERRAVVLASSTRAAEVLDDLVRMVGRLTTERQVEEADHSRFHLAVALFNTDRPADAAEVAEEALYGADRSGNQGLADQARHLLATVYRRLDEPDQSLGYLEQLAVNLDGYDNAEGRARVLEQAGELLFELDRDGQAADRFRAAAAAYGVGGLPLDRLRALRRQMLAAMFAEDAEQAMRALAQADEVVTALPVALAAEPAGQYETAWLALDSARSLVGLGDPEAALARVTAVPERFRELASFSEAFLADLTRGEILLSLGRSSEAEQVLRQVVNGLPRDAGALPRAAYALAYALVHQGKAGEAERLASEYGFELD
jgi:cellulose synthase operon protein C